MFDRRAIVTILGPGGTRVGCGFLAAPGKVFTCAHVVAKALVPDVTAVPMEGPPGRVDVEFGHETGKPRRSARVAAWVPKKEAETGDDGDIAGLVLEDAEPDGVIPLRVAVEAPEGRVGAEWKAWGVPREGERWSKGRIIDVTTVRRLQLSVESELPLVKEGFSGTPLIVGDEVVGIVAEASTGDRPTARAVPAFKLQDAWAEAWIPEKCPYPGWLPFTEDEVGDFFGRDLDKKRLRGLVEVEPLVVLIGPSGAGKSSLVQAGLVPAVTADGWLRPVVMTPGVEPKRNLNSRLASLDGQQRSEVDADDWISAFRTSRRRERLLVVVDQAEQLALQCDPKTAEEFLGSILAWTAAGDGRADNVRIVVVVRADFHDDFKRTLLQALPVRARFELEPLSEADLRAVMERPSRPGWRPPEEALVERLLHDADGNLPLVQSALRSLWEEAVRRHDWRLTRAAYDDIGGIRAAVLRGADDFWAGCYDQDRAGHVMAQFVTSASADGRMVDTRRRVVRSELRGDRDWEIVLALAQQRLVVLDGDGLADWADLAHDSLITQWPVLKTIVEQSRPFRSWQDGARRKMREWEEVGRDRDALLQGRALDVAVRVLAGNRADVEVDLESYIETSRTVQEGEDHRFQRLLGEVLSRRKAADAHRARTLASGDLAASVQLAVEALMHDHCREADLELRAGLALLPPRPVPVAQGEPVYGLAWGPSGRDLLTVGLYARLWDAAGAGLHAWALGHEARSVAISGREDPTSGFPLVAVVSEHDGVQLVDVPSDVVLFRFAEPEDAVETLVWSPDGRRIAMYGPTNGVLVQTLVDKDWHPAKAELGSTCNVLAWSPDSRQLLIGGADGTASTWDLELGPRPVVTQGTSVRAVAWSADGRFAASGDSRGTVVVWDVTTGAVITTLAHRGEKDVCVLEWRPGARTAWLAVGSGDGSGAVRVWDVDQHTEIAHLSHPKGVFAAAWSPAGDLLASASLDGAVRTWDVESEREVARLEHQQPVRQMAWSPDGARLATRGKGGTLIWEPRAGAEVTRLPATGVAKLAWSPRRDWLATGGDDPSRVWDMRSEASVGGEGGTGACGLAWNNEGDRLACLMQDGTIELWDVEADRRERFPGPWPERRTAIAFGPAGVVLAAASGPEVELWDLASGSALPSLCHGADVEVVEWNATGTKLASAGVDSVVRIWDVSTGHEMTNLDHGQSVTALAWKSDGSLLATAAGGAIRLWNLDKSTDPPVMADVGRPLALALNPSATFLATAGRDTWARVWDVGRAEQVAELPHRGRVRAVAWEPSTSRLVTASADGEVRLWAMDREDMIAQARLRLPARTGS